MWWPSDAHRDKQRVLDSILNALDLSRIVIINLVIVSNRAQTGEDLKKYSAAIHETHMSFKE